MPRRFHIRCVRSTVRAGALGVALLGAFAVASLAQELGEGALRVHWRADAGRAIDFTPRFDSTSVYVASTDPRVSAYDLESGERRWSKRTKQSISAPIEIGSGRVLVALGDEAPKLRALDTKNGDELWTIAVKASPVALSVSGNAVVALEKEGTIESFACEDGAKLWSRSGLGPSPAGISSDDSTLFVAGRKDSVLALARTSGRVRWKAVVIGRRAAPPVLAQDRLILTGAEGREVHLDVRTGVELDHVSRTAYQLMPCLALGNLIVSASSGGVVEAWDASSGSMRWSMELGSTPAGPPVMAGGHLFVLRRTGRLSVIRLDKGDEAWSLELPGEFAVPPCAHGKLLLLAGDRGDLYVYGRDDES